MNRSMLSAPMITVALGLLAVGCGKQSASSQVKFRPFDPNANNIFMVIGAPNGLTGVATDVREMANVLNDQSNGFNWNVKSNGNATKAYILQELTANAAAVGEFGTLGLYVSGHGSRSGEFMTADGMLRYSEVAQAIGAGRADSLKRLMAFNDSCFSGHWVDGNGALPDDMAALNEDAEYFADHTPEEAQKLADEAAETMASAFEGVGIKNKADKIEQFLTFAASKKTQTSLDYGRTKGGAFTYALRQTFATLKAERLDATVSDLVTKTADYTWRDTRHHLPVAKAVPSTLMEEKLFEFAGGQ